MQVESIVFIKQWSLLKCKADHVVFRITDTNVFPWPHIETVFNLHNRVLQCNDLDLQIVISTATPARILDND